MTIATATPSTSRPARTGYAPSRYRPLVPAAAYRASPARSSGLHPKRSTNQPEIGANRAMASAGRASTILARKSGFGTRPAKAAPICGSAGATIAPAMTVSELAASSVTRVRRDTAGNVGAWWTAGDFMPALGRTLGTGEGRRVLHATPRRSNANGRNSPQTAAGKFAACSQLMWIVAGDSRRVAAW